jgi:hypothetical protein
MNSTTVVAYFRMGMNVVLAVGVAVAREGVAAETATETAVAAAAAAVELPSFVLKHCLQIYCERRQTVATCGG